MNIEYRKGDLLESNIAAKTNAVNSLGFMGAGIAKAFRQKYPEMFEDYRQCCKDGYLQDRKTHFYKYKNGDLIVNLVTVNDELKGEYDFIIQGLEETKNFLLENDINEIAFPPLGCGIGGLKKATVEDLIVDVFKDTSVNLYLYNF